MLIAQHRGKLVTVLNGPKRFSAGVEPNRNVNRKPVLTVSFHRTRTEPYTLYNLIDEKWTWTQGYQNSLTLTGFEPLK